MNLLNEGGFADQFFADKEKHINRVYFVCLGRGVAGVCEMRDGTELTAIAKCSPEDTYDEQIGICLAMVRLKVAINDHIRKKKEANKKRGETWVPKEGEKFYSGAIRTDGSFHIASSAFDKDKTLHQYLVGRGNTFETEEEAKEFVMRNIRDGMRTVKNKKD